MIIVGNNVKYLKHQYIIKAKKNQMWKSMSGHFPYMYKVINIANITNGRWLRYVFTNCTTCVIHSPPQPPLTWVTEGLKIILTPSPLTLNSSISKYRRLPMFKSLIDLLCARYHSDFGQVSKPNICILIVYSPTI